MSNIKMGLTIEEAAECTGIGRNTMRKLVDWGKLPVLKVGRKAIIRRDTLERFMSVNQGRNLLNENDVRKVFVPSRGFLFFYPISYSPYKSRAIFIICGANIFKPSECYF